MNRILIVEDDPRISTPLEKGLRINGFKTAIVRDGYAALQIARSADFDLLLLNLGLPGKDGWDVLRELRDRGEQMPIIILTARDSVADRVKGLTAGANDYVIKPFSFQELLARVQLRLRDAYLSQKRVEQNLQVGTIKVNLQTRQVWVSDRPVDLSAREFALFSLFLRHPNQVIHRERILRDVWGYESDPGTNIVDVYVRYLRKKIQNNWIESIRGIGYRFLIKQA